MPNPAITSAIIIGLLSDIEQPLKNVGLFSLLKLCGTSHYSHFHFTSIKCHQDVSFHPRGPNAIQSSGLTDL